MAAHLQVQDWLLVNLATYISQRDKNSPQIPSLADGIAKTNYPPRKSLLNGFAKSLAESGPNYECIHFTGTHSLLD